MQQLQRIETDEMTFNTFKVMVMALQYNAASSLRLVDNSVQ